MPDLDAILAGFSYTLGLKALLFCFLGASLGTFIGVLPGIGALATISMLLPVTFYLEPAHGLIMLAGIFYGAQYGGSTASILLNLPGTASAAVTCLDGYPMARNGRAGVALFVTTISSFVGSSLAILVLMFLAPVVAGVALRFGSPEFFSVMLLALVAAGTLSTESAIKGLAMVVVGLSLGLVGADMSSGVYRFTFGIDALADGLNLVAVVMGLFGVAEVISNLGVRRGVPVDARNINMRSLIPTRDDVRQSFLPTLRGSVVGIITGILPGLGPQIAAFMSYSIEKRVSRTPEQFGKGAMAGVAAPEAANNASVQSAFIPTLSLGIPGDAIMAVMIGALMMHGILPGPQFMTAEADLFWALVASFWIGNIILLFLNIPLIGVWVRVLSIPYAILYPAVLFFIAVGVFSIRNSVVDVVVVTVFGLIGYGMTKLRLPPAPLLLGFVLGPLMEEHLRRALIISRGSFRIFVEQPISLTVLIVTALLIVLAVRPVLMRKARCISSATKTAKTRAPR